MKKLVLVCGILASVVSVSVSVSMGAMSYEEWERARHNCFNDDKSACQALINNGMPSIGQCDKNICLFVGSVYFVAERYREAIPYLEKAIALGGGGDNRGI